MNIVEFEQQLLDITNKYPRQDESSWIFEMYEPKRLKPVIDSNGDLLHDLFKTFDLSELTAMGLYFNKGINENEDYFLFGGRDTDMLVVDKKTLEVKFLTEDDELLHVLARTFSDYLSIFVALSEFSIKGFFGHNISDEEGDDLLKKCKEIVKDSKYFSFYEELLA
ncbi:hypothetical protein [Chitinophaga ginsengisoli]|uniref:SUKH-4 immunity protein of toxin-antitoxin system n=1 Tax=Chitinophaga ginsengisoli TaxID=363837 RepID=A0A2P8FA74_9BACT|nr:hypothetical protein [Chitinophaga ginsengisoli]PSL18613.1 hypothetical protein CLV42_1332 [Chitinophaga ginsengisoli]